MRCLFQSILYQQLVTLKKDKADVTAIGKAARSAQKILTDIKLSFYLNLSYTLAEYYRKKLLSLNEISNS